MKTFAEIKSLLKDLPEDKYEIHDISHERWREYVIAEGNVYRITNPVALVMRKGGHTHRVVDGDNVAHCVIGPSGGAVIRWFNGNDAAPVNF